MVESLVKRDYQEAAQLLAKRVGKGFESLSKPVLRSALREASGKNCSLTVPALKELEDALRFERIEVYPSLTEKKGPHRLYHRDSAVAFLVRVIVDSGSSNDKKLETFLTKEVTKQADRLTVRRRQAR